MNRKFVIGSVAASLIVVAVGGAIYASPWWSLHQIRKAAQERDIDALAEHVDIQAVRQSVRLALGFQLGTALGQGQATDGRNSKLAEGARQIASMALDPLTEAVTSPTLLMGMLINGRLSHALVPAVPSTSLLTEPQEWNAHVRYINWSTVWVERKDAPNDGAFILRRHGLADWKLSGFQLPQP